MPGCCAAFQVNEPKLVFSGLHFVSHPKAAPPGMRTVCLGQAVVTAQAAALVRVTPMSCDSLTSSGCWEGVGLGQAGAAAFVLPGLKKWISAAQNGTARLRDCWDTHWTGSWSECVGTANP